MTQLKPKIRLYVPQPFSGHASIELEEAQSHYLARVMRCQVGEVLCVFNGMDGEYAAEITHMHKKHVTLQLQGQRLAQAASPDIWLAFAPVKNKNELIVEKATELGVSRLLVVFSRHAVVKSINRDKLMANMVEAAEQSERLDVPELADEYKDLATLLGAWPKDRVLLHGDESGAGMPIAQLLASLPASKYGVLVGPEGGFSAEEQQMLKIAPQVKSFSMGPRILKADTAVVAALACVQAHRGDWEAKPSFRAS